VCVCVSWGVCVCDLDYSIRTQVRLKERWLVGTRETRDSFPSPERLRGGE